MVALPAPTDLVSLPPETSSTTPIVRRSQPPDRAVRRRLTPSGICATPPRCPRPRACQSGTWPRRSGPLPPLDLRLSQAVQSRGGAVALLPVGVAQGLECAEHIRGADLLHPSERAAWMAEAEHHA